MVKQVRCGDIVKTPFGIIIVEKIKADGTLIGHELKGAKTFWSKNLTRDIKILNSDFSYKQEQDTEEEFEILMKKGKKMSVREFMRLVFISGHYAGQRQEIRKKEKQIAWLKKQKFVDVDTAKSLSKNMNYGIRAVIDVAFDDNREDIWGQKGGKYGG